MTVIPDDWSYFRKMEIILSFLSKVNMPFIYQSSLIDYRFLC